MVVVFERPMEAILLTVPSLGTMPDTEEVWLVVVLEPKSQAALSLAILLLKAPLIHAEVE